MIAIEKLDKSYCLSELKKWSAAKRKKEITKLQKEIKHSDKAGLIGGRAMQERKKLLLSYLKEVA